MKKYISIIVFSLIIAGSSCKKDFLSLEKNPNVPSVASPDLLLAGSLKQAAVLPNSNALAMYAGWMGYLSWSTGFQINTALEQYIITSGTYDLWTNYYLNISNFAALTGSGAGPYYNSIAKIMTAFDYEALVDNYNNVPYSQAIQGTKNLTPAYDSGSAIYDDLMKQLDAAITTIQAELANNKSTALVPGAGDIVFKGNMTKWVQFANSLKLRLALRQSNLSAKTGALKAAVAATQSLGYGGATANPGYLNSDASGGQQSPLWLSWGISASGAALGSNATYQANAYGAHFYGSNNDPRLGQVYSTTTTKNAANATGLKDAVIDSIPGKGIVIVSSPFGDGTPPNGIVPPGTSRGNISPSKYGPGVLKSPTMDANIMSAAESFFLQAEAVAAGYISGNAATLYNQGIAASFADDLVPNAAAAAAAYAAQPQIAYPVGGTFAQQQKAIIVQKWAALNLYGASEAFNEYRRTGYPDDIPLSITPGSTATKQVARIPYPNVEYSTNSNNVVAQGTIDIFNSKIFWAK
jgi:hypothetical protein